MYFENVELVTEKNHNHNYDKQNLKKNVFENECKRKAHEKYAKPNTILRTKIAKNILVLQNITTDFVINFTTHTLLFITSWMY